MTNRELRFFKKDFESSKLIDKRYLLHQYVPLVGVTVVRVVEGAGREKRMGLL